MAWLNSTGPRSFPARFCCAALPLEFGGPTDEVGVCAFLGAGGWFPADPFCTAGTALLCSGLVFSNGAPWPDPGNPGGGPFCAGMLKVASGLSMLCCTPGCQLPPGGRAVKYAAAPAGACEVSICVARGPPIEWMVEPDGVVTRMLFGLFSRPHSIR